MAPEKKVLVIEDDPDQAVIFATVLQGKGYVCKVVGTAVSALGIVNEWTPDLVVCDLRLPEMDGLTFVSSLQGRKAERGELLPRVILATAASDLPLPREILDAVDRIYYKSQSVAQLSALISNVSAGAALATS